MRVEEGCKRLSGDAVITSSHNRLAGRRPQTKQRLNMQPSHLSHRPQQPRRTRSVSAGGQLGLANGNCQFGQRLRINWLIDFSSINSIVSGCCCCCCCGSTVVTTVDLSLPHSLSLCCCRLDRFMRCLLLCALYWPQHFCCHDKLLSCLACWPPPIPCPPSPARLFGMSRRRARYTKRAYDKQFVFIAWP